MEHHMLTTTDRVRHYALAACCAAALVAAAACGGNSNPANPSPGGGSGGGGGSGSTAPTLTTLSSQIFVPRCSGCHGSGLAEAGLNLEPGSAHAALVNVASSGKQGAIRVIPGNPDGSYLIQKLRGDSGIVGPRMPRSGPFLTDDQINLIRQWIQDGARNN
jgi:hypothetical protein